VVLGHARRSGLGLSSTWPRNSFGAGPGWDQPVVTGPILALTKPDRDAVLEVRPLDRGFRAIRVAHRFLTA